MARRTKTGRRANAEEREIARRWVELYRLAEASPDGRHCVNPEDEPEIHSFVHADDTSMLLFLLDRFAKHGTFANLDDLGIDAMLIRSEFEKLRKSGETYQNAVAILAEKNHCSISTIERMNLTLAPSKSDTV